VSVTALPTVASGRAEVERLAAEGPRWLGERRLEAWSVYERTPMPDPHKDEDWRRMSFVGLDLEKRPVGSADAFDVRVEGALPQGVIACSLGEALRAHPDLVREFLGTAAVPASRGKFEALSAALFAGGAFVYVPKGVAVEPTILVRGKAGPAAGGAGFGAFRRSVIVLEPGASATVLVVDESEGDAPGLKAAATEVHLRDGAALRHAKIQVLGEKVWSFDHRRALVGRDASVEWVSCDLGARVAHTIIEAHLGEQGGRATARSMIFGDGRQFVDLAVRMIHVGRDTESDMLVRAALADTSRAVYRGYVDIKRGAKGTNSQQKEAVLLMSPEARSDAIPSLYIDENDVKAGHGATAGRVDEKMVFYLMSRGLKRKAAEKLVVEGFFMPLMERITIEALRDELLQRIDRKIDLGADIK
jgi:FeS assembly protein SufD